jgi:hypothetical protein
VASGRGAPSPVIGLLVVGALLLLIEGLVVLALLASAVSTISLPALFLVASVAVGIFPIILALVVFLLTWRYAGETSSLLGAVFIVLGALSFLFGAGFVVGGIMIILAGALAMFAEWLDESLPPSRASLVVARNSAIPGDPGLGSPGNASAPGVPSNATRSAPIVIYSQCLSCGELNPPGYTLCQRCGAGLPPRGPSLAGTP